MERVTHSLRNIDGVWIEGEEGNVSDYLRACWQDFLEEAQAEEKSVSDPKEAKRFEADRMFRALDNVLRDRCETEGLDRKTAIMVLWAVNSCLAACGLPSVIRTEELVRAHTLSIYAELLRGGATS